MVAHAPAGCGFEEGDEVFGAVPPLRGSFAELVTVPLDQVGQSYHCMFFYWPIVSLHLLD
jgi:hypothetical protein